MNGEPGVFNGFAPSLNFKHKELYVSAPGIWGLGSEDEDQYGTLASRTNPSEFIKEAYIYTNRTKKYNKEKFIEPLAEYLKCLKAPKNLVQKDFIDYSKGEQLFKNNCMSCHNLKNGGGDRSVNPYEIGVPTNFIGVFDDFKATDIQSKRTFKMLKSLDLDESSMIKVRRLNGIWTRKNLTSNGQIKGFDHLFCLEGKTRDIIDPENPKTQGIHLDLCDNYSDNEKISLKEYLKNF